MTRATSNSTNTIFVAIAEVPINGPKKCNFKLNFNWMAINSINYLNPIKAYKLNMKWTNFATVNLDLLKQNVLWKKQNETKEKLIVRNKMETNTYETASLITVWSSSKPSLYA